MPLKPLSLMALVFLAACNAARPLPAVKDAGDRAFQRGDYATANTNYQEYVERKPGEAEVQIYYAKTLMALGEPAKAVEHASIAYDQRPSDDDYMDTLAAALYGSHRTEDLYRFLRGLTSTRGRVQDYIRLGQYAAKLGDADGAEHALKTAAQIDRGQTPGPQLALAEFYRSIGDKANAVKRLRMAMYVDRNNLEISKALRDLGEIPGPSLAIPPEEQSLATAPESR
jgi:tetratricopeptide (TPR) repeat protein